MKIWGQIFGWDLSTAGARVCPDAILIFYLTKLYDNVTSINITSLGNNSKMFSWSCTESRVEGVIPLFYWPQPPFLNYYFEWWVLLANMIIIIMSLLIWVFGSNFVTFYKIDRPPPSGSVGRGETETVTADMTSWVLRTSDSEVATLPSSLQETVLEHNKTSL